MMKQMCNDVKGASYRARVCHIWLYCCILVLVVHISSHKLHIFGEVTSWWRQLNKIFNKILFWELVLSPQIKVDSVLWYSIWAWIDNSHPRRVQWTSTLLITRWYITINYCYCYMHADHHQIKTNLSRNHLVWPDRVVMMICYSDYKTNIGTPQGYC